MPRYFFNVSGLDPGRDNEGQELSDDGAAWREATLIAAELFKVATCKFQPNQHWWLQVTDQSQTPIYLIGVTSSDAAAALALPIDEASF
jgi:hypothetical protein